MEKKISVIIPTFNCQKFVKETIFSVVNQTYKNIEIIVIDDCSSDDTVKNVLSIEEPRIKLISNETNKGAAYCRNKGIANATGEYIAFLDGDDLWSPDKLSSQISYMENNNYDFCYTDYELIDENGKRLGIWYSGPNVVTYRMFLKIDYIGTSTVIFKRSVYPDLSIPETILKRNDDALWLTLSKRVDCYRFQGIYSFYRKRNASISSGKKSKLFKHHVVLYEKLYNFRKTKAFFYALRNVFYYLLKQIKYKNKTKSN